MAKFEKTCKRLFKKLAKKLEEVTGRKFKIRARPLYAGIAEYGAYFYQMWIKEKKFFGKDILRVKVNQEGNVIVLSEAPELKEFVRPLLKECQKEIKKEIRHF